MTGDANPNAASWTLWVVIVVLNAVSYGIMTGDSVKAYLLFASSLGVIAVFVNAFRRGAFKPLSEWDRTTFFIGIIAIVVWWRFNSATYGNIILQFAFFISFIPTLRSVIKDPLCEPPIPWFLWGISIAGMLVVVLLRWQGQLQDLIYPIQGSILHTLIGIFALRGRKFTQHFVRN